MIQRDKTEDRRQELPLTGRLSQARRQLLWRQWTAIALTAAIAAAGFLLVLSLFNHISPWQEGAAFAAALVAAIGFAGAIGYLSWKIFFRPPSLQELAVRLEERHPEWMDALICSVEREMAPEAKRRSLEKTLIEKTRRDTAGLDFASLLIPPRFGGRTLAAGGGLLLVLLPFVFLSGLTQKAFYHFTDRLSGEPSGIAVEPGNAEVPRGQDVRVEAGILRWESQAEIEYIDRSGHRVYPMHARDENHSFTFYHVEDDIRYRVVTPSLRSPWYQLSAYTPPAIDEYELRVTPPEYTGLPEETYSEIGDIETVEGSVARVTLRVPDDVRARLRMRERGDDLPLAEEEGAHTLETRLEATDRVRFVLEDDAGREARTPEMQWNVRPDYPPTVEITRPARDLPASPEATVNLSALVADDFGLTDITLHYSVSGQRREQRRLFSPSDEELPTERTARTDLDLDQLEVEDGDVVSYFITASDNREPDAQTGRSEVYFLEIREESEPEEMEGEPAELESFDIQALIVELKRLIRRSWEGASAREERRRSIGAEVASDLERLQEEIRDLQRDAASQLGEEAAEPLVVLLDRVIQRLDFGAQLAGRDVLEESIPPQEMALADLVAIQNALMNQQSSSEESSDGDPGQQPPQRPEEEQQENLAEELEDLLQETRRLADNQAAQNTRVRRLSERGATDEQQAELQDRQETIRNEAERIRNRLAEMEQARSAQGDLAGAGEMMNQASERIGDNALGRAARSGERARAQLLAAMEGLEQAVSQATHNQIAQLASQAQQLAGGQAQAAGASREMGEAEEVPEDQAAGARDQQRGLQRQLSDLLSEVDATSRELRESNPEASGELTELSRQLRQEDVEGQMGRAGNALLYRRFDRAAEMQEEAAGRLGQFAEQLGEAAERMPSLTRDQLHELLSDVQRSHRDVMSMAGQAPEEVGEQLQNMQSRLGRRLDRAGRSLPDSPLQEIGGSLLAEAESDSGRPNIFRMEETLRAAGRALEEQIFAMEMERQTRLQRQTSDPPEEYRNLVEEYFRNLSEQE